MRKGPTPGTKKQDMISFLNCQAKEVISEEKALEGREDPEEIGYNSPMEF